MAKATKARTFRRRKIQKLVDRNVGVRQESGEGEVGVLTAFHANWFPGKQRPVIRDELEANKQVKWP